MKKTLVLGASLNPERYSNLVISILAASNHEVVGIGLKDGVIDGVPVYSGFPKLKNIHTITLYLNEKRQVPYYEYVISLQPKRVIFNPGTKNKAFEEMLEQKGIFYEFACTMVLLSTNQY